MAGGIGLNGATALLQIGNACVFGWACRVTSLAAISQGLLVGAERDP